jgi:hypothetical protein
MQVRFETLFSIIDLIIEIIVRKFQKNIQCDGSHVCGHLQESAASKPDKSLAIRSSTYVHKFSYFQLLFSLI